MNDGSRLPVGLVLAGGRSRRMGADKAFATLGGQPLLRRVLERLAPQCAYVVVNSHDPRARAFGHEVVPDEIAGRPGPLAGILAGLDWIAMHAPESGNVVSVPVDTPFLPLDLAVRLASAAGPTGLVCAATAEHRHPVVALWPVELRHSLRRMLVEEDVRRVAAVFERHPHRVVRWPEEPFDPFLNLNTPADLAAAERLLGSGCP